MQAEADQSTLQSFSAYPFDTDEAYQQGLSTIIQGGALESKSHAEVADLVLKSKVFYFNRITGGSLDVEQASQYLLLQQQNSNTPSTQATAAAGAAASPPPVDVAESQSQEKPPEGKGEEPEPPRVLTFKELEELIRQGKTDQIPNNKKIPEDLNAEPPTVSTQPAVRKPWEVQKDTSISMTESA